MPMPPFEDMLKITPRYLNYTTSSCSSFCINMQVVMHVSLPLHSRRKTGSWHPARDHKRASSAVGERRECLTLADLAGVLMPQPRPPGGRGLWHLARPPVRLHA